MRVDLGHWVLCRYPDCDTEFLPLIVEGDPQLCPLHLLELVRIRGRQSRQEFLDQLAALRPVVP